MCHRDRLTGGSGPGKPVTPALAVTIAEAAYAIASAMMLARALDPAELLLKGSSTRAGNPAAKAPEAEIADPDKGEIPSR